MNLDEWVQERRELLAAMVRVRFIVESSAPWDVKYDLVFSLHQDVIRPGLDAVGINFEYYDPDGSYEDDVRAYDEALFSVRKGLESALVDPPTDLQA